MLYKLRDYIKRSRGASRQQLARAFSIDEHALEPMLDFWVRKGIIQIEDTPKACNTHCNGCASKNTYYT